MIRVSLLPRCTNDLSYLSKHTIDPRDSHKHIGACHHPNDPEPHLKTVSGLERMALMTYCKVILDDHDPEQKAVEIRKDGSVDWQSLYSLVD
jgi:hypothetical protein